MDWVVSMAYKDKEKANKNARKWYAKNRVKVAAKTRDYQKRHPEKDIERHLKANHGITFAVYNDMLIGQGGVCKICKKPCKHRRRLSVDHDHATGKIRGLLCHLCNAILGMCSDSPEILETAVKYLREE